MAWARWVLETLFGMEWAKWVLETLFGATAAPLAWPARWWHWAVFAPALLLALTAGMVSAVISSPLWLPVVILALAPLAIMC